MTGIYFNELFLQHDTGFGHPERPDRLRAILELLSQNGMAETRTVQIEAPAADIEAIARVHERHHIEKIRESCLSALQHLDGDTVVSERSYEAALLAAGAGIAAADAVMAGELSNAFCAVRPPGHHAEVDRAMGFCLFNNIAIVAQHLKARHGVERIFILDWDVHHGNGTQQAFYQDPQVFFMSLHQWPLYPGTGSPHETGAGKGASFTQNVTFAPHTDAEEYVETFRRAVDEVFRTFKPEFTLISAGFDAHLDDPLAQLMLSEEDFAELTRFVAERAATYSSGRMVSMLEGGYHLQALARSVQSHIDVLTAY